METRINFEKWTTCRLLTDKERNELLEIKNNTSEMEDRFYKDLEFGTGGVRGLIGLGSNRINIYTVRRTTQGLANYLIKRKKSKSLSVAIAYDSRHFSKEFALQAALVLSKNDIKVSIFQDITPTPELSFAVRRLKCDAGIVITASHNPSQYNGYKVYGEDGGQITLNVATEIQSEVEKIDIFNDVKFCEAESEEANEFINWINIDIDREYVEKVVEITANKELNKANKDLKIVYTPLHGTGLKLIQNVLNMLKYKKIYYVESQCIADGDFPTVNSPNPEEQETLSEAVKLAENVGGDLVIGTDPDSDRVGVAIKLKSGKYKMLSGNQIGALLTYYLASQKKEISKKDIVIKTIVTSELGAEIAMSYGATVINTLTGFKFIGEKIREYDNDNNRCFLFGYEESYGYLTGTFVRDKDAIIASALIAEMAMFYKLQGKNLVDVLNELYLKYGFYLEELRSITFQGELGQSKMQDIVNRFRDIHRIKDYFTEVDTIEDYKVREKLNLSTLSTEQLKLPSSNVLKIKFTDRSWFAIRPSGTEPKLKIYYSVVSPNKSSAEKKLINLISSVEEYIKNIN